ncbi:MAG: hydroxymethylglutaryl-CoA reductase, degradative [Spirochaetes bacterium]|jgi:hydroxymethylglutaryl-CoA reductase|nr:hydroxymethylglutaryl-CoA reductase, degradative [Spirochaetota bacterium]
MSGWHLPRGFRKLSASDRRAAVRDAIELSDDELGWDASFVDLADVMVESSVGVMPVPMGIATGFLLDGESYDVPLATEEPSVIAAASFAAGLIARAGGFASRADDPVMTAQVFLEPRVDRHERAEYLAAELEAERPQLEAVAHRVLKRMAERGGGFRDLRIAPIDRLVKIEIDADVRDAMGANLLNTLAEQVKEDAARLSGAGALMAVLTNAARSRRAQASFAVPVAKLARAGLPGSEVARRIVAATEAANADADRAVTHNKGVMNGISSLALATANDTRAIEAAAHAWAARDGVYRSLTSFSVDGENLRGFIDLPLAFATVGGAVSFHPYAERALALLGRPNAPTLSRIAAAVGLAQNFAAVYALVSEGIQHGHMRLHATRVAYKAGARGDRAREVGHAIWEQGEISEEAARRHLLPSEPQPGGDTE